MTTKITKLVMANRNNRLSHLSAFLIIRFHLLYESLFLLDSPGSYPLFSCRSFSGSIACGKGSLQVVSACIAVNIKYFTGKVEVVNKL